MKAELKKEAVALRSDGYSYSDIQKRIGVSKSTLTVWLSKLPYVPNEHVRTKIIAARTASKEAKRKIKQSSLLSAQNLAKKDVGIFTKRDLFMLGLGIYIGEGSKTAHTVRVVNSDPVIMRFAVKWFKSFGLTSDNFRLRIFLYPDSNKEESEKFWLKNTGLKKENILKCQIDRRKDKRKDRRGKLPHGTAHLSVISAGKKEFGVLFFRRILALIDIVLDTAKE